MGNLPVKEVVESTALKLLSSVHLILQAHSEAPVPRIRELLSSSFLIGQQQLQKPLKFPCALRTSTLNWKLRFPTNFLDNKVANCAGQDHG